MHFFSIPSPLLILFFIFSMYWCQVSLLSIITPRYFASLLNSNGSPLIYTSNTLFLHAGDKSKHKSFDLSTLSVSLFAFSQFAILSREVLMLFFNWLMFLFAQNSAVSSAKRWNAAVGSDLYISWMYIKNRRSPSTLPCGTPQVIL